MRKSKRETPVPNSPPSTNPPLSLSMALHIPIFFLSLQPLFSDGYLTHTHIHTHTFAILTDTRISPNEEQTKTRGNVSREVDCNFNAVLNSSRKANGWFGMEYDPSWALFDFNRIISRWMITDQKTWDNNKLGLLARFFFFFGFSLMKFI